MPSEQELALQALQQNNFASNLDQVFSQGVPAIVPQQMFQNATGLAQTQGQSNLPALRALMNLAGQKDQGAALQQLFGGDTMGALGTGLVSSGDVVNRARLGQIGQDAAKEDFKSQALMAYINSPNPLTYQSALFHGAKKDELRTFGLAQGFSPDELLFEGTTKALTDSDVQGSQRFALMGELQNHGKSKLGLDADQARVYALDSIFSTDPELQRVKHHIETADAAIVSGDTETADAHIAALLEKRKELGQAEQKLLDEYLGSFTDDTGEPIFNDLENAQSRFFSKDKDDVFTSIGKFGLNTLLAPKNASNQALELVKELINNPKEPVTAVLLERLKPLIMQSVQGLNTARMSGANQTKAQIEDLMGFNNAS